MNNPMITFVTDIKENEPDILVGVCSAPLKIYNDDHGNAPILTKEVTAPAGGWTHEKLCDLDQSDFGVTWIGDAYLDGQWIGSTEV